MKYLVVILLFPSNPEHKKNHALERVYSNKVRNNTHKLMQEGIMYKGSVSIMNSTRPISAIRLLNYDEHFFFSCLTPVVLKPALR